MFAIIETGGKQYKVNEGDIIFVHTGGAGALFAVDMLPEG